MDNTIPQGNPVDSKVVRKKVFQLFPSALGQVFAYGLFMLACLFVVFLGSLVFLFAFTKLGLISESQSAFKSLIEQGTLAGHKGHGLLMSILIPEVFLTAIIYFFFRNAIWQKIWAVMKGTNSKDHELWKVSAQKVFPVLGCWILMNLFSGALAFVASLPHQFLPLMLSNVVNIFLFLFLFIIQIYISIKILFWQWTVVFEKRSVLSALWRSWQLTTGYWWFILASGIRVFIWPIVIFLVCIMLSSLLGSAFLLLPLSIAFAFMMPALTIGLECVLYETLLSSKES